MQLTDEERKDRDERLEKRIREFQRKNFGQRFEGATLSKAGNSLGSSAIEQIQRSIQSKKNFLVLLGAPGTGKTYLCAAIAGLSLGFYDTVRCWKEEYLFAHLRDSIERFGDYANSLKFALDDQLTILDDLGSTPVNDWRKEIIFNTVDIRYASMLPTIVTSNLTKQEISYRYEPRTADRLFAKENTIIDLFDAVSLRQEGL